MSDPLSTTLAALADPTRRAILARLALGETAVTELAEPFAMSLPAVSKHLKVLERAGLIARGRAAQWRPCRLQAAPLKDVADWIEGYRRFWEQSLDRLEVYLRELQAREARQNQETSRENEKGPEKKRGPRKPPGPNATSKPE
jgi:DNA-binding transcriptional ArsR family regulator